MENSYLTNIDIISLSFYKQIYMTSFFLIFGLIEDENALDIDY